MSWPEEPAGAVEELAGCRDPFLIGVRHHSPALAAAVPAMLERAAPEVLLVELPEEFAPWLAWLADPATVPPVALAGSGAAGGLVFLPFAEFSPELAAIRWAREAGVEVVPFDLPLAAREAGSRPVSGRRGVAAALRAGAGGRPGDDLWDRLVEAPAPGSAPEELRRAALLVGWALRADEEAVDPYDLRREAHMRRRLGAYADRRAAAVIGAFHAPALLPGVERGGAGEPVGGEVVTSLVPYAYGLLDERSGYPAGIRDPEWQRGVYLAGGDPALLDELLLSSAVGICAAVRDAGHPSGPADAREVVRVARDLATLRGLPAAGRGELAEAAQTVLTQGQLFGRGRVVAAAMERVLVGDRRGRLAPGTPRSGLGPAVEALLGRLSLPAPDAPERREVRLDPLRGDLDRAREICLRRLAVCGVPYGEEAPVAGVGGADALTTRWTVAWTPSTAAMLDVTGVHGVTLEQAAAGVLRRRHASWAREGGPTAAQLLEGLREAARCGLPGLAAERLAEAAVALPASGTLPELLDGLALVDRIRSGHVPGLPVGWRRDAVEGAYEELAGAGVRALDGLAGSTDPDDARALVALARRAADTAGRDLRLADALARLDADGTPLIRGAAGAARVLLGQRDAGEFGALLASRADGATTPPLRAELADALRGALLAAGPLLETGRALEPLLERVGAWPDRGFLDRLPALRAGFDALSPAARSRVLAAVEDRTGLAAGTLPDAVPDAAALARLAWADLAGREALAARGLGTGTGMGAGAAPAPEPGGGSGAGGGPTVRRGGVTPLGAGPSASPPAVRARPVRGRRVRPAGRRGPGRRARVRGSRPGSGGGWCSGGGGS